MRDEMLVRGFLLDLLESDRLLLVILPKTLLDQAFPIN